MTRGLSYPWRTLRDIGETHAFSPPGGIRLLAIGLEPDSCGSHPQKEIP